MNNHSLMKEPYISIPLPDLLGSGLVSKKSPVVSEESDAQKSNDETRTNHAPKDHPPAPLADWR